jgi:hypothetical protein
MNSPSATELVNPLMVSLSNQNILLFDRLAPRYFDILSMGGVQGKWRDLASNPFISRI